jgi:hypothetical protein
MRGRRGAQPLTGFGRRGSIPQSGQLSRISPASAYYVSPKLPWNVNYSGPQGSTFQCLGIALGGVSSFNLDIGLSYIIYIKIQRQ